MSNPFEKLGKFVDKNKWQIASVALMAYTGYAAFGGSFGATAVAGEAAAGLTAGQATALGTATAASGMMAAGEADMQNAKREREREEKKYNKETVYFGLDRNATMDDAKRRGRTMTTNARPVASNTSRSSDMANATPKAPATMDDLINSQYA